MIKKILITCILITALLLGTCMAYAEELDEPIIEEDNVDYVDVSCVEPRLQISGSNAICKVRVDVFSSSNANKVVLIVKYLKSSGVSVGTKTAIAYRSGNSFSGQTTNALSSHGTYHAKVNIKVYHDSQLIESFNVLTGNVTY